jgi:hypothetical protein
MRLINFLVVTLISVLLGCTSIRTDESSSTNVVIRDHFITGSGYEEVLSQAKNYCQKFGAKPVFVRKQDASFLRSEYNNYYFDCVKNQPYTPPYQPPKVVQTPPASIDAAKEKCTTLGFKAGTESFGKCVLQLSK